MYNIQSTRSKIKKIALDNDIRTILYSDLKTQQADIKQEEEENIQLIKKTHQNSEDQKPEDELK